MVRKGEHSLVRTIAAPYQGVSTIGLVVDLGIALVYVFVCLIVMARAPPIALSALLGWLLGLAALVNSTSDFQYTAPNDYSAYVIGDVFQLVAEYAFLTLTVYALSCLPVATALWRRKMRLAAPALALPMLGDLLVPVIAVPFPVATMPAIANALYGASVVYGFVAAFVLFKLARDAPAEQRARVRWFVSTIALCGFIAYALYTLNDGFIQNGTFAVILYYSLSFTLIGPVYATLRLRLVDLDLVISRSAVYGIISLVVIALFLSAEWATGAIANAIFGRNHWSGIAAQLVSFGIAIGIGFSMRSLHARVESAVNAVVFRDRLRELALLENLGHEADFVESRRALVDITFERVREALKIQDVALYILDDRGYACRRTSGNAAPDRLNNDDGLIARLLETKSPAVTDSGALRGWLIVPLAVRARLIGLIACGPKPDHTTYLPDELRVFDNVAHRVAASYVLLGDLDGGSAH
ncbi:MAG: GAF domain-containing protein [Candidatus Tumulicola sp.]